MPRIVSTDQAAQYVKAVVLGAPKVGKTFCAGTLSEFWGKKQPLKDLYWIGLDVNAVAGFAEQGIVAPYVWDFSNVKPNAFGVEIDRMLADLQTVMKETPIKGVVVDTISALDIMAQDAADAKDLEAFPKWDYVKSMHKKIMDPLLRMPVPVVFLAHYKQQQEGSDKSEAGKLLKNRAAAHSMDGGGALVLAVSGGAAAIYKREVECVLVLDKVAVKPGVEERRLYDGKGEVEGGSRYRMELNGEEANLKKLFEKFRTNALKGIEGASK